MMSSRERELLEKANKAILSVYKTIGTPGDYGYYTPKGEALRFLYDVNNEIIFFLKPEIDPRRNEPTAEPQA